MPYAETPDGRTEFEDSGGDGPPVLLSPDDGSDRRLFTPQMAALSDVYRVVTWDRPDTEEDASEDPGSERRGEVEAAFALLDGIGVERAVLGGVGAGAEVSLRAALRQPDRVRALVLIDPPDVAAAGLADRLPELAMPVLLVSGEGIAEHGTPLRQIGDRVDDCRGVVELPDAPEPVNQSRADRVNEVVRSFLESLPA